MTAEGRSSAMHKYFSHAQPDNNALGIYDKRPATLLPPLPYRMPGMSIRRISFLFMRYIFKDNTQAA